MIFETALFHNFMGLSQFLEVKFKPLPNEIFMLSMRRLFIRMFTVQKLVLFEILHLFMILWDLANFLR